MRKSFFIINPAAGKRRGLKLLCELGKRWDNAGIAWQAYVTNSHEDIAVGVDAACRSGATEIIIAGGDGTIRAVVNALQGRPIPIGIIPCGSGNDFVRSNGLDINIDRAIDKLLCSQQTRVIDVGVCNELKFLNVASVGIDAAIAHRAQKIKRWFQGPLVYLVASIIEILIYKPIHAQITIDGRSFHRSIELAAIANGQYYGGGMKIAPMANPCDGLYDVILINAMAKGRLLRLLPTLYSGKHLREREVEVFSGRVVTIQMEQVTTINMDGELISDKTMIARQQDSQISIIGI